jgi:hypothetical protein
MFTVMWHKDGNNPQVKATFQTRQWANQYIYDHAIDIYGNVSNDPNDGYLYILEDERE